MAKGGNLYLIPSAIDETFSSVLLADYLVVLKDLRYFVVENIRSARRFIKQVQPAFDINSATFWEIDKHHPDQMLQEPIQILRSGLSIGLLSEAGCPGIADPGSKLISEAHRNNIRVVPWIGPSSILLALMASGMNGQQFAFHGYLPQSRAELAIKLKQLEAESARTKGTQLFIETPYRNESLFQALIHHLKDSTTLCLAIALTGPDELILRHPIGIWKKTDPPSIHKKTTLFLIEA